MRLTLNIKFLLDPKSVLVQTPKNPIGNKLKVLILRQKAINVTVVSSQKQSPFERIGAVHLDHAIPNSWCQLTKNPELKYKQLDLVHTGMDNFNETEEAVVLSLSGCKRRPDKSTGNTG